MNKNTNEVVAIKIFKKTHAFEKNKESLMKEYEVMQKLSHPNLIRLIDIKSNCDYVKKNGDSYKVEFHLDTFYGGGGG